MFVLREVFVFREPPWVARIERKLDQILIQGENDRRRDIRFAQADIERDEYIMAQVQIAQEDLDTAASALFALVARFNSVDITPLAAADQTALNSALTATVEAANRLSPQTPDVPAPNEDPAPTETPDVPGLETPPSE